MDSDPPPVAGSGQGNSPRSTRPLQQPRRKQYLPTQSPSSGLRPGQIPDGAKPRQKAPDKTRIKTRTDRLAKLDSKFDEVTSRIPSLKIGLRTIDLLRWLINVQALAIIVLLGTVAAMALQWSDHSVYGALTQPMPVVRFDNNGALLPGHITVDGALNVRSIRAMTAPTYTRPAILSWASTTATEIMNFGFHNAVDRLSAQKQNFTSNGWDAFITALDDSKLMEKIVSNEQVITAAPIEAPVILKVTDNPDGTRQWLIQVPFMVTILSGKQTEVQRRTLTLSIRQVPPDQNLAGLAIDNWIAH